MLADNNKANRKKHNGIIPSITAVNSGIVGRMSINMLCLILSFSCFHVIASSFSNASSQYAAVNILNKAVADDKLLLILNA